MEESGKHRRSRAGFHDLDPAVRSPSRGDGGQAEALVSASYPRSRPMPDWNDSAFGAVVNDHDFAVDQLRNIGGIQFEPGVQYIVRIRAQLRGISPRDLLFAHELDGVAHHLYGRAVVPA